jgi:hypothetical protein
MKMALFTIILTFIFVVIEWFGREGYYALDKIDHIKNKPLRWLFYFAIIFCVFLFKGKEQQFVYFQF